LALATLISLLLALPGLLLKPVGRTLSRASTCALVPKKHPVGPRHGRETPRGECVGEPAEPGHEEGAHQDRDENQEPKSGEAPLDDDPDEGGEARGSKRRGRQVGQKEAERDRGKSAVDIGVDTKGPATRESETIVTEEKGPGEVGWMKLAPTTPR